MIESGTKVYRSRMKFRDGKIMDADYFTVYPLLMKFCLPGDIWKIHTDMLIRYQPMLAPVLTPAHARVRFAFVPLRLVEPNTELTITGSEEGHLYTGTLPEFDTVLHTSQSTTTHKGDFCDIAFGLPPADYTGRVDDKAMPAAYFYKAYARFWWDFFRDENLWEVDNFMKSYSDFDTFVSWALTRIGQSPLWNGTGLADHGGLLPVYLQKNYLTSALPWQLKGVAPTVPIGGTFSLQNNPFSAQNIEPFRYAGHTVQEGDVSGTANTWESTNGPGVNRGEMYVDGPISANTISPGNATNYVNYYLNEAALNAMINGSTISAVGAGFNAADLRAMMAQTRIFERLARTGSRYTEYLRANFGTSPADGTLQRAQYLGGFKVPIITSEVLQTAEDGTTPVGTMRGHGVSRGGDHMQTFHCHEFGVLLATIDFRPEIEWTQGIDRQFTYKSRFDFFNPSFQHLSEQEIRNGEIFLGTDTKNDDTFGFQAYAQELRMGRKMVVGDMRDTLAFWTQTTDFSSRPALNQAMLKGWSYRAAHHKPFAVVSGNPIILQFEAVSDVYRPMVRYGTPGLVDHL